MNVPLPDALDDATLAHWLVSLGQIQPRHLRALVEDRVRAAILATSGRVVLTEASVGEIVAQVIGGAS